MVIALVTLGYLSALIAVVGLAITIVRQKAAETAVLIEVLCTEKAPVWRASRSKKVTSSTEGWKDLDLSEFDGIPEGMGGSDWAN